MLVRAMAALGAMTALVAGLLSPSVAPAAAAPPAAADAIVTCLVRSAIVPIVGDGSGAAADARDAALRTLRHVLLLADPDGLAAAEPRLDDAGRATGLDVLEAVPGAAAAAAAAAIGSLPAHQRALVSESDVHVAGSAGVGLRALCDGLDRALAATGTAADALVSVAIDHARATLRIGVEAASPAAMPARRAPLPTAASGADAVAAAPSLGDALGLAPGLPVELVADVRDAPATRLDDRDGLGGGVAVQVGGAACTTGFAIRMADGGRALMSAGHCTSPDGTNGASVVNGFQASLCGSAGSGATIGRVEHNLLTTGWAVDSMAVRTASAAPTMWLGSRCTGTREVPVQGIGSAGSGDRVGFSGTRQGEQYGSRTSEPAGCYDFGFWSCSVYRAMSSSSTYVCLPGDSGGPAYRQRADGGVQALGVISASGYDLGINRCSYVDLPTALWISGATIMTQASTVMAPPTRLAGADRYATAAAISRHGYPSGAAAAYVASGEGFADALSAGAAAAHRRAPLLLTGRDALPASVRTELQRLRPGSIVLAGGTPSVSAAVEAELAAIAPVERLAGADRYETSALIAQHAFPDGASSSYVATGRGFPDALAAGPVAALRGAPVLLVDGASSAQPATTLAALTALGTVQVTIVGGTPSVSQSVAAALGAGRGLDRVAGVDRFDTAARLNQAFATAPPALYVASGEQFPDALAVSAVAGARPAPLYLTRAGCLAPVVQSEHARLGRPPVVLVGGLPTLRDGVQRYELCE
ncbi:cell wall-binding repeat-containing protein [Agrococcus sp. DT81.2]|uniref:cell wall-binding repeat-containing protein n=1 Tax=Agrococcus sp. DT81.2 TaxID=3393414 RepID=UPI003CE44900